MTASERTTLDRLTREILRHESQVGRGLYEIGTRLARIRELELWRAGRYDSFGDYVQRALRISTRNARRFIRVARHFSAAVASRYGADKLEAAIAYLQATPADERPGDLLAADLRLRGDDGRYYTVPLHEASAAQIREATRLLFEQRSAAQRVPRTVRARLQRLAEALPEAPPGTTRGDRVRVRRGRDGRLAVSFAAIPLEALPEFLRALQRHLKSG